MFVKEKNGKFFGLVNGGLVEAETATIFQQLSDHYGEYYAIARDNGEVTVDLDSENSFKASTFAKIIAQMLSSSRHKKTLMNTIMPEWVALEEALEKKGKFIIHSTMTGRGVTNMQCPLFKEEEGSTAFPCMDGFVKESEFVPHVYWKSAEGFVALDLMSKTHLRAATAYLERYADNAFD